MVKNITYIFIVVFACAFCYSAKAQENKNTEMKIVNTKPSVFITYERSGRQEPLFEGESKNRIWLRLHNNTRLKIFLCQFSVDKKYGDIGVFYEVNKVFDFKETSDSELPSGYGKIDTCDIFSLESGQSVSFSLPQEHLTKGLAIKTQFYYGWTGDWEEDVFEGTKHFVAFGHDELSKQKKLKTTARLKRNKTIATKLKRNRTIAIR